MSKNELQPIIIKKKKGHGHGAHGGSWKVAYADFVTAMMAFFLLLWLLSSTTPEEKKHIAGYFNDPGGQGVGPGGTSAGIIPRENPFEEPPTVGSIAGTPTARPGETEQDALSSQEIRPELNQSPDAVAPEQLSEAHMEALRQIDQQKLEALKDQLEEAVKVDPVFQELREQVLIDVVANGLRIQIIDKENRPSFDSGSPRIKKYTEEVIEALAPLLNKVPNRVSITGHTDATPYPPGAVYTNWELSADRANTARRALEKGGLPAGKVAKVEGLGASMPFKADAPLEPINRRIAIVVLKKEADREMAKDAGLDSGVLLDTPDQAGEELQQVDEEPNPDAEQAAPQVPLIAPPIDTTNAIPAAP